jgi:hypothetical protein
MNTKHFFYFLILFGCSPTKKGLHESEGKKSDHFSFFKEAKDIWPEHFSIKRFCTMMDSNRIKEASRYLNLALLAEPDNKNLHLLNGLIYEERSRMGDVGCDELASVAYQRARGEGELSWVAFYFSGMRLFKSGKYAKAQKNLAKAFASCPENPKIALALACASYCSGDLPLSLFAIQKSLKGACDDTEILNAAAIIFSASKQSDQAQKYLEDLKKIDLVFYEKTLDAVQRWDDFYKEAQPVLANLEDGAVPADAAAVQKKAEDKVPLITMDCVLLTHDEDHRTSKGNNLLEKLTLSLGDATSGPPHLSYSGSQAGTGLRPGLGETSSAWTKSFGYSITQGALNYSLNIMNVFRQTTSVMTRPTITTAVGQEGYFHQGSQYIGATPGSLTGSALASFDAGIMLQATPVKLQDGRVSIELTVEGSYFPISPSESSGITEQVVRLEKSKVSSTVNVKLGKTALVGSVHMKSRRENKSGFPGLSSIPFIQYFFGRSETSDIVRSIVVLITPHLANVDVNDETCKKYESISKSRRYLLDKGFKFFEVNSNFCDMRKVFKGKSYLFRSRDIFFGKDSISLKRNLWTLKSFLWY